MDFGVVVILAGILVSGFVLGMLLSVAGPRDEETAAMHARLMGRARARLPGGIASPRRSASTASRALATARSEGTH